MDMFTIDNKRVSINSLKFKSKTVQLKVMRDWFFDNFEDPANCCPYESREGGYFYIYGGPYNADEELQEKFGGYIKSDFIQELVDDLQDICYDWSGNSSNASGWYDEDLYEVVTTSNKPHSNFLENITKIRSLSLLELNQENKDHFLGILYTNIITALETLYVELFINSIDKDNSFFINYIKTGGGNFKASKDLTVMPFIPQTMEELREKLVKEIKEHLIGASWHSTEQVIKRYKSTFGIKVQNDWPISEIENATLIRNHLIHRGGKDKNGDPVIITENNLNKLLEQSVLLSEKLYASLKKIIDEKNDSTESEF
ncbi:hypothetical protein PN738_000630 [Morganella morganii]|nr:hypothetical protein [Morganella morganii]HEI9768087.1 hypothetical protein [Morganella morganii]